MRPGRRPYTKADVETIRRLWVEGATCAAIAAAIGRTQSGALWNKIAKLGLPMRRHGRPDSLDEDRRARLAALWAGPKPLAAIAEELGCTESTVQAWRARMGLPARGCDHPVARRTKKSAALKAGSGAAVKAPAVPAPPPRSVRTVVAHPFWTPERDALILRAGGAYVALASLVPVIGKPMPALMQRWHQLRVAA